MNGMLAVLAGIMVIGFMLTYFPSMEAPFIRTGAALEDATGYSVDHGPANAAQAGLYGILAMVLFFAAMTDAGIQPRNRGVPNQ